MANFLILILLQSLFSPPPVGFRTQNQLDPWCQLHFFLSILFGCTYLMLKCPILKWKKSCSYPVVWLLVGKKLSFRRTFLFRDLNVNEKLFYLFLSEKFGFLAAERPQEQMLHLRGSQLHSHRYGEKRNIGMYL